MNEVEVQPATEETVVRLVRAARANDAEATPARHSQQTDRCPPVARFSAVLRCGGAWTTDEAAHVSECRFCKRVYDMFVAVVSAASEAPTVGGAGATLDGARVASGEETIVDRARAAKQPPASPDDTVTDKRSKKKRD
jgi:hypothetical protein